MTPSCSVLLFPKPADLPVQYATKYALAINTGAAQALGLEIPKPLLGRADEIVE